jgi:hypothetical protein
MILSAVRNHPVPAKFHVVFFYNDKDQLSSEITRAGAVVHHLPAGNPLQLFIQLFPLVRLINKLKPDVVHAHLPLTGFISMIAAGLTSTPLLYTEHNLPSRYRKITGFLHRFTLRFCKNIIAVSEAVLSDLNRMAPNAQARLLENGVDVDFFNPGLFSKNELRRKFNIPENKVVIGTVAVFTNDVGSPKESTDAALGANAKPAPVPTKGDVPTAKPSPVPYSDDPAKEYGFVTAADAGTSPPPALGAVAKL